MVRHRLSQPSATAYVLLLLLAGCGGRSDETVGADGGPAAPQPEAAADAVAPPDDLPLAPEGTFPPAPEPASGSASAEEAIATTNASRCAAMRSAREELDAAIETSRALVAEGANRGPGEPAELTVVLSAPQELGDLVTADLAGRGALRAAPEGGRVTHLWARYDGYVDGTSLYVETAVLEDESLDEAQRRWTEYIRGVLASAPSASREDKASVDRVASAVDAGSLPIISFTVQGTAGSSQDTVERLGDDVYSLTTAPGGRPPLPLDPASIAAEEEACR